MASISIHALLAESDLTKYHFTLLSYDFYPRSPCGERPAITAAFIMCLLFLSTLSLRRATLETICCRRCNGHFYPRSPCGERHISFNIFLNLTTFLSTLSLRRATMAASITPTYENHFYPRSPCGERPLEVPARAFLISYFYPRSPCGERPEKSE